MGYYGDNPDAGLDWFDAECKRHAATKLLLAEAIGERDKLKAALETMSAALEQLLAATKRAARNDSGCRHQEGYRHAIAKAEAALASKVK